MTTHTDWEKRDRLAYLALYHAIHGDGARSEKIRRVLRQLDDAPVKEEARVPEPVCV